MWWGPEIGQKWKTLNSICPLNSLYLKQDCELSNGDSYASYHGMYHFCLFNTLVAVIGVSWKIFEIVEILKTTKKMPIFNPLFDQQGNLVTFWNFYQMYLSRLYHWKYGVVIGLPHGTLVMKTHLETSVRNSCGFAGQNKPEQPKTGQKYSNWIITGHSWKFRNPKTYRNGRPQAIWK